ncbi:MAG: 4-alpha-glucanotransferase [Elusimicrobia bacterium]|nr:4-alpha-glucanotransferase [Elusimicrobiota bacterium]MDE2426016.1 4-alpha-glucanotransferase [Elusimicrobiota bacterium]
MRRRRAGVLLHVTSLPGGHGCGDLGPQARRFADFLAEAGQAWWQTLPVGPVGAANSPYSSPSSFAGNAWLISLEDLVEDGLLEPADLAGEAAFTSGRVDYAAMRAFKGPRLRKAFAAFTKTGSPSLWAGFLAFLRQQQDWVEDYATFRALKRHYGDERSWTSWEPAVRARRFRSWPRDLLQAIGQEQSYRQFEQFLFARQWERLRDYAARRGVGLIGDVPIFVAHESADVWAHAELFQLDSQGRPTVVAGVPPDYFSADGQLWGNPHYRWGLLKERGYDWWLSRLGTAAQRFDAVRLDHFIGFENYWEIPACAKTAREGRWVGGPGADFLERARRALPQLELIAEDLGCVTPAVVALRERFDFPGMRVMQFAFGADRQAESFLPRNYPKRTVAYTGTHDNDTTVGWYNDSGAAPGARSLEQIETERHKARVYLSCDGSDIAWDMIAAIFRSQADTVLVPVQDLLSLGSQARMNRPGTVTGNWEWRLRQPLDEPLARRLARLTEESGRFGETDVRQDDRSAAHARS